MCTLPTPMNGGITEKISYTQERQILSTRVLVKLCGWIQKIPHGLKNNCNGLIQWWKNEALGIWVPFLVSPHGFMMNRNQFVDIKGKWRSIKSVTFSVCTISRTKLEFFLLIADDCEDNMQLEIYNARQKLKVEVYHRRYLSWNITVLEVLQNVIHKVRGYSSYNF